MASNLQFNNDAQRQSNKHEIRQQQRGNRNDVEHRVMVRTSLVECYPERAVVYRGIGGCGASL
eukprot:5202803-Pyramimonas_sp.AAC.1